MDSMSFPHRVTRLAFDTGQPYEEFRARYQDAVPALDPNRLAAFAKAGAAWPEVVAEAGTAAPHGFLLYWRSDLTPLMSLAGNTNRCTAYLMGNHTIAERMYRYDPSVMLYAPLCTVIYGAAEGPAWFAVDQPSTVFGSFARPEILEVGLELDRKLADLLDTLDIRTGGRGTG